MGIQAGIAAWLAGQKVESLEFEYVGDKDSDAILAAAVATPSLRSFTIVGNNNASADSLSALVLAPQLEHVKFGLYLEDLRTE